MMHGNTKIKIEIKVCIISIHVPCIFSLFCTMTNKCKKIFSQFYCKQDNFNVLKGLYYWDFKDYSKRTWINPVWNILIINCITNCCIWNTCVTWQGIDYKLPWGWHDSVETCSSVMIWEIIVHLLVTVQNINIYSTCVLYLFYFTFYILI